jgi:ABC-type transporter MlaC component
MTALVPRRWSGALATLLVAVALAAHAESLPEEAWPASPTECVDAALRDMTIALAAPPETQPTRTERLRAVMVRYVDIAQLGRNTVGATWALVPAAQQADFLATFQNFLAIRVSGSLGKPDELNFGPARVIEPKASRRTVSAPANDAAKFPTLVATDLRSGDGVPRTILFAVGHGDDGRYRIVDVSAEGISLGRLLTADFSGFLNRNGGRLEALVSVLQEKVANSLAAR